MSPEWMSLGEVLLVVAGMTLITFITRGFFFIPERELAMPDWIKRGLRYAPLAALSAVVAPEVLLVAGGIPSVPWLDARVPATAAATLYFFWRRGILGTIVVGMTVLLSLRIGLGW